MKRSVRLRCGKCGSPFSLTGASRTVVSCPGCSCLLDVAQALLSPGDVQVVSPPPSGMQKSRSSPPPSEHLGRFRCLKCAKVFVKAGTSPKPPCERCSSEEVIALTPVAAIVVVNGVSATASKTSRLVRDSFKAMMEIDDYLKGMEDVLRRAALPESSERRLLQRAQALRKDILSEVESFSNQRLDERLRATGVADGQSIF